MKLIELLADERHIDDIRRLAKVCEAIDFRLGQKGDDGRVAMRLLVHSNKQQVVLDLVQEYFGGQTGYTLIVVPVEAGLPKLKTAQEEKTAAATESREALYNQVLKGAELNSNFLWLVALSSVVAILGLLENNVAVIIGAMVIAPLLGPNLAIAYGSTLGDWRMVRSGVATNLVGITLAISIAIAVGAFWSGSFVAPELLARANVGIEAVALALVSGAAATLSLTAGVSSVLVGVMVAVALLPPTVAAGLFASQHSWQLAGGALLLLGINLVSVVVSAKIVFNLKGFSAKVGRSQSPKALLKWVSFAFWFVVLMGLVSIVITLN